jgi:hypothetical protein
LLAAACACAAPACSREDTPTASAGATSDGAPPAATASEDEQAARDADRALGEALARADRDAAGSLLDPEFSRVSPSGVLQTREAVLAEMPEPLVTGASEAETSVRRLGSHIVVVQYHNGKAHVMRVWVRRSSGWRVLHASELSEGERVVYGGTMMGAADCINPCKVVPFVPANATEKAVMESWQAQQTGPEQWARHVPDDNVARTSNGTYTKADRIAVQEQQIKAGATVAPSPLVWARISEFGDAALMIALQPRAVGKPFWGSRVFELRDGTWVMAESYQTTIQDMPPF